MTKAPSPWKFLVMVARSGLQMGLETRVVPVVPVHPIALHSPTTATGSCSLTQEYCKAHLAKHGWEQHPGSDKG